MSRQPTYLDDLSTSIRSSQRAPRSCLRCAKKRIKCDKNIPCRTCTARGMESSCTREIVRVKGKVVSGSSSEVGGQSYADLLEENRRLKATLQSSSSSVSSEQSDETLWAYGEIPTITEAFENAVHPANLNTKRPSTVRSLCDIWLPNVMCSRFLFEHGVVWTSWIHFAIHVPTFRLEHSEYWAQSSTIPILHRDPLWLALYFSFLSVTLIFLDDQEAACAELPHSNVVSLLENWYDASLYFLDQAEFMRNYDMRAVQTIAILLSLYKNMGDFSLHSTHLACAIRISQHLELDKDGANALSLIDSEVRRRVWWTITICEWMQRPNGVPLVRESDFDVATPLPLDDEELFWQASGASMSPPTPDRPRPIHYHLVMIDIAKLWHRFRTSLTKVRQDHEKLENLICQTDDALAAITKDLPPHLQEEASLFDNINGPPWIPWQRNNLSMTLLYYRMAVNRVLQDHWVQSPNSYVRTQEICLGSAQAIIAIVDRITAVSARNRVWGVASALFSAAVTLAVEARFSNAAIAASYSDGVRRCIAFLSAIRDRNVVAARAIEVLNSCLNGTEQLLPFQLARSEDTNHMGNTLAQYRVHDFVL